VNLVSRSLTGKFLGNALCNLNQILVDPSSSFIGNFGLSNLCQKCFKFVLRGVVLSGSILPMVCLFQFLTHWSFSLDLCYLKCCYFTQIITLSHCHLIGKLMENATFCCLFHEITSSTWRDIKDFVSQNYGAKFQIEISRSSICKFIHDITTGKLQITFWLSKYIGFSV
jgi:hypothetical protein